jgi:hypothetical protein
MGEILTQIWFFVMILPFLIISEGNAMFAKFLKKNGIYAHWDMIHLSLLILVVLLIVLLAKGYR